MEKTIKFEMTKSQAEKFEKLLDATLEILNRMEKESPERQARSEKHHKEFMKNIAEMEKKTEQTSRLLSKWTASLEN